VSWPSVSTMIMAAHRHRSRRCIWASRRHWRPATLSTNPGRWLSNVRRGSTRPRCCWVDVVPSPRWCGRHWRRTPRPRRSPTHPGSHRQPTVSWPRWRKAGRPGRCGMSGPKHNDSSAPSTCPLNIPRHWWTCWSMRCSVAGRLPWPRRTTASRSRRCCGGSTGPRSTPWLAPPSTPRSGSSTPRLVSSPPPDDATGQPSSRWRWT
jgi:hypothetical protein